MRKFLLAVLGLGALSVLNSTQAQNISETVFATPLQRNLVATNYAENSNIRITSPIVAPVLNEEKYIKFKKMRNGGIVLTSVGAGMLMGGTALLIDGANDDNYDYWDDEYTDGKIVAGALGLVVGALSVGGGITMWVIGNNKMKKYGGGNVQLIPTKNGIRLAYRF